MKILHICVTGPYTDGFNYQENLLTKYQVKDGHEVHIIASEWQWGQNGKIEKYNGALEYKNHEGVYVHRLPMTIEKDIFYRYKRFLGFYGALETLAPEVIFIHNIQFFDIDKVVRYAKKYRPRIFVDNHADFSNSARSVMARLFYKTVWRHYAHLIEPYTTKFYGVLPARVDFLKNIYRLPTEKCELLVMGADDEKVEKYNSQNQKDMTRQELGYDKLDFIVVTGGKIDQWKKQTLLLMDAIRNIEDCTVKLLIFGTVDGDIQEEFDKRLDSKRIKYVGWADNDQSYKYFSIADLVVFPGRHSVYWEQVAGMGIPMLCKYWEGTTHVNTDGNVVFLDKDSNIEIQKDIEEFKRKLVCSERMNNACEKAKRVFSYRIIAKKSIMDE